MASKTKMISLLPCPEHHIRGPRDTHSSDANPGGSLFPFLKLDIIRHNNMGKHGLDFIRGKEPTWTERETMSGLVNRMHDSQCSPCVSPQSKSQMFARCRDHLVSVYRGIPFTFTKLRKAKSVKLLGVRIDSLVAMYGTGWDGDECACGNSHTIGKCEGAQRETDQGHWRKGGALISYSYSGYTREGIQLTDA
jgi:hypothetical protein